MGKGGKNVGRRREEGRKKEGKMRGKGGEKERRMKQKVVFKLCLILQSKMQTKSVHTHACVHVHMHTHIACTHEHKTTILTPHTADTLSPRVTYFHTGQYCISTRTVLLHAEKELIVYFIMSIFIFLLYKTNNNKTSFSLCLIHARGTIE